MRRRESDERLPWRSERRVVRHAPPCSLALLFRLFFGFRFLFGRLFDDLESGHGDGRDLDRGVFLAVTGVPTRVLSAAELADFELLALYFWLDNGRLNQGAEMAGSPMVLEPPALAKRTCSKRKACPVSAPSR